MPQVPRQPGVLSPREIQVIQLVCRGLTYPEIGRRLNVSKNTVASHVVRARAVMGARSTPQLIAVYLTRGGTL